MANMRVLFDEGPPELTVAETGTTAQRGEPIEVPDKLGTKLVEQGPWKRAADHKPKADSPSKAKTDEKENA